jgi:hypothetical protein
LWMPLINTLKDQRKTHEEGKRSLSSHWPHLQENWLWSVWIAKCWLVWVKTHIHHTSGLERNLFSLGPGHDHVWCLSGKSHHQLYFIPSTYWWLLNLFVGILNFLSVTSVLKETSSSETHVFFTFSVGTEHTGKNMNHCKSQVSKYVTFESTLCHLNACSQIIILTGILMYVCYNRRQLNCYV